MKKSQAVEKGLSAFPFFPRLSSSAVIWTEKNRKQQQKKNRKIAWMSTSYKIWLAKFHPNRSAKVPQSVPLVSVSAVHALGQCFGLMALIYNLTPLSFRPGFWPVPPMLSIPPLIFSQPPVWLLITVSESLAQAVQLKNVLPLRLFMWDIPGSRKEISVLTVLN